RSRHRPPRLGHSPDGGGQGAHHQSVCRTPRRDGARDEWTLAGGARDAHRPVETARHPCRGTTHTRRRSDPMTATLDSTKTAQTYAIDKMHSEVAFQVRHLLTK